jgi:formylglycine-generating enzyme required for sulfatase activity
MTGYLLSMLLSCGGDAGEIRVYNPEPKVEIISHTPGDEVVEGQPFTIVAQVSDLNHGEEELGVIWYKGTSLLCDWTAPSEEGRSTCQAVLYEGDPQVSVVARDPGGESGTAAIQFSILPNEAPTVLILSPVSGQRYYSNQLIEFKAKVSDAEDDSPSLTMVWESSVQGVVETLGQTSDSNGVFEEYTDLSEGNHSITLTTIDTSGKESIDSVGISVLGSNTEPECSIHTPEEGDGFELNSSVTFGGSAFDEETPYSDLVVSWYSDKDGFLGTSSPDSAGEITTAFTSLTEGDHSITMDVVDDGGLTCSRVQSVVIDIPPSISLIVPSDSSTHPHGESILFQFQVLDNHDTSEDLTVEMTSDLQGSLDTIGLDSTGLGQSYLSDLQAGSHLIVVSAEDSSGLEGSLTFSLDVNTRPEVTAVSLEPEPAYTGDVIMAVAESADADGDMVSLSYAWYVDGALVPETSDSLDGLTYFDRDQVVQAYVTPNDGFYDGEAVATSEYTIPNAPPSTPSSIAFDPPSPVYNEDSLTCVPVGISDADGDVLAYTYTWSLNGELWEGATENDGATIPIEDLLFGDEWTCEAFATDGYVDSEAASETVEIGVGCQLTECDYHAAGVDFITIEAGSFVMGSPILEVGRYADEEDHIVYLNNDFYMMTTEVTQGMFENLMGYNPSYFATCGENCPVENVTWHEAASFSNALSLEDGLVPCYSCVGTGAQTECTAPGSPYSSSSCTGYRLPTEAEWEFSARGGSSESFDSPNGGGGLPSGAGQSCSAGLILDDGTLISSISWYCGNNATYGIKEVAQKLPNTFGLYDMYGNIKEWCNDWYDLYSGVTETDPSGPVVGTERVVRGGYWFSRPQDLRASARSSTDPSDQYYVYGFRLVRVLH